MCQKVKFKCPSWYEFCSEFAPCIWEDKSILDYNYNRDIHSLFLNLVLLTTEKLKNREYVDVLT